MFLQGTLNGVILTFLFWSFIYLIKKIDNEHGMPEMKVFSFIIGTTICFVEGMVIGSFIGNVWLVIVDMVMLYLLVMGYSDYYTMRVYRGVTIVVFLLGVICLAVCFMNQCLQWYSSSIVQISIYIVIAVLGIVFKVYGKGDGYLFLALFPYLYILSGYFETHFLCVASSLLFYSMLLVLVCNVKSLLTRRKKIVAFVPYIQSAFFIECISELLVMMTRS